MMESASDTVQREPWVNHGTRARSSVRAPFKPKDIWTLRVRFQMENRGRELALLSLGIHSKLAQAVNALAAADVSEH
jgi:hypothetical protein